MVKKGALSLALVLSATLLSTVPGLAAHRFVVINAGRHTAPVMQISGVNRAMWGPNLIHAPVTPGMRAVFSIGEGCAEDVRIIYGDRHQIVWHNINTCTYNLRLTY